MDAKTVIDTLPGDITCYNFAIRMSASYSHYCKLSTSNDVVMGSEINLTSSGITRLLIGRSGNLARFGFGCSGNVG